MKNKKIAWLPSVLLASALILWTGVALAYQVVVGGKVTLSGTVGILFQGGGSIVTGLGLTGNGTSGSPAQIDTTVVPQRISAVGALTWSTFGSVTGGSNCQSGTISMPGAVTGDALAVGPPSVLETGLQYSAKVSSSGVVTIAVCDVTTTAITSGASGLNWNLKDIQ
jgi:hypothetical protein